jgi:hypothetical protein
VVMAICSLGVLVGTEEYRDKFKFAISYIGAVLTPSGCVDRVITVHRMVK